MGKLDKEIRAAEAGNIGPLVEGLKGKPFSPSGIDGNISYSGHMESREWLEVESAVMDGELSEANYDKVRDAVYGDSDSDGDLEGDADEDGD
jgi:hypothetical protein